MYRKIYKVFNVHTYEVRITPIKIKPRVSRARMYTMLAKG